MKILFKDKSDLYDGMKSKYPNALFSGARDPFTNDMSDCQILSVKSTIVDNDLIKRFSNLKWIVNRSNISDNINLKHCADNNIGVVNTYPATVNMSNWIESIIKKEYYLPYYTIYGSGEITDSFKSKFKYIKILKSDAPDIKIEDYLSETHTLIVTMPLTSYTKGAVNKRVFSYLPKGSSLISVSNGLVIDNDDLYEAIMSGRIAHAQIDRLNSHMRKELIATGKVTFHRSKSWKYNCNVDDYINNIITHIDAIIDDAPIDVILDRHEKCIDIFWD